MKSALLGAFLLQEEGNEPWKKTHIREAKT